MNSAVSLAGLTRRFRAVGLFVFFVTLTASCCVVASAANPCVGWRGDGTGIYPDADPPLKWSATDNVVWKTPMPAISNASPVVMGDRIFVCSEPSTLLCVSATDGAVLWSRSARLGDTLPENERREAVAEETKAGEMTRKYRDLLEAQNVLRIALAERPDDAEKKARLEELKEEANGVSKAIGTWEPAVLRKTSRLNGYATPTPTTDGKNVFVAFGTGIVACYDMNGQQRWVRRLPTHPDHYSEPRLYGVQESPLLAGGMLLVHFWDLTALDPASGEIVWRAESRVHFGSPVHMRAGDIDLVVTVGGDVFRIRDGHCVASKIWLSKGLPLQTCCSPIVTRDVVCLLAENGGAARLKLAADGEITSEPLWAANSFKGWYVASPVRFNGLLYTVKDDGIFCSADVGTGDVVYRHRTFQQKGCYPSVTLAGPYLFASSNEGETVVIGPGREYEEVARNTLEPFMSSLVFSGKRMYVRGQCNLYCIEGNSNQ